MCCVEISFDNEMIHIHNIQLCTKYRLISVLQICMILFDILKSIVLFPRTTAEVLFRMEFFRIK